MTQNHQDAPVIDPEKLKKILAARKVKISLHYPEIKMKRLSTGMVSIELNPNYKLIPMSAIEGEETYNRLKNKLKIREV